MDAVSKMLSILAVLLHAQVKMRQLVLFIHQVSFMETLDFMLYV